MVRHIWSVLCGDVVIDKTDHTVSMFRSIESIQFQPIGPERPEDKGIVGALPVNAFLVSIFHKDDAIPREFTGKISVYDPTGRMLVDIPFKHQLKDVGRLRAISKFEGFPITTEGTYWVRLFVEKELIEVAAIPVDLVNTLKSPAVPKS